MEILVGNAINSSSERCTGGCPSWLLHWENYTDMDAGYCSVVDCNETEDLVGGHVYIEDEEGDNCYIIPLCKAHNHHDIEDFWVDKDEIEFVPDYELRTCTSGFEYDDEE